MGGLERYEPIDGIEDEDAKVDYVNKPREEEELSSISEQELKEEKEIYSNTGKELFALQESIYNQVYGIDKDFVEKMNPDHYTSEGGLVTMNDSYA